MEDFVIRDHMSGLKMTNSTVKGDHVGDRSNIIMVSRHLLALWICAVLAGCGEPASAPGASASATKAKKTIRSAALPDEFAGDVVKVLDGDVIEVLVDEGETLQIEDMLRIRVRLYGIDCPERGQPFGNYARDYLSQQIRGDFVFIVNRGEDEEGRILGDVIKVPDPFRTSGLEEEDRLMNHELVAGGLAWHNVNDSDDETLAAAEKRAREAGWGLWSGPQIPIPPWAWREMSEEERNQYRSPSAPAGADRQR